MTKQALLDCASRFTFFPSIADLKVFFEERTGPVAPASTGNKPDLTNWLKPTAEAWWQTHDIKTGRLLTEEELRAGGLQSAGSFKPLF